METIDKTIVKDLKKMNKTMTTEYIRKQYSKKTIIESRKEDIIQFNKIKYRLPKIKLEKRYLKKYNDLLNKSNYNILYADLLDSGYYEYDMKLKQHLSKCGLNRVKQLYGTCWLDSLINTFIYGDHIKTRLLELINRYFEIKNIKDIKKFISTINNKKLKLANTVDKDKQKIFLYLISILYTVFCDTGMRNKTKNKHDNFILTNFAINIRNYNIKKSRDLLKAANISYNSYYAHEHIIYIFNKYIDPFGHIKYYKATDTYSFANKNHLNILYFTIGTKLTNITGGYGYYYEFKNIDIMINRRMFTFTSGNNIDTIDPIDFLIFSCTNPRDKLRKTIPKEITCIVNNVKTKFKLESAAISIDDIGHIGHALTGLICQNEYYIYDSNNNYFKIDWTDLTYPNTKEILNYYKIVFSATNSRYDKSINKSLMTVSTDDYIVDFDMYIEYATYYNTTRDFSFKMERCNPHRPD